LTAEKKRLRESIDNGNLWRKWGPYLTERQWGTVREDYSAGGTAWDYITHDMARSRAYRWGEEGIGGISDDKCFVCFAPAFWNGRDPILKERFFGLSGEEGNHGEDVKEYYYYLDNTPTHSYMKMLYKYPQAEFPYRHLTEENKRRSRKDAEFELMDTGIFADDRYFDIFVEYAKNGPEDILIRLTIHNRGPESCELHVLPQIWFRNRWSWGYRNPKPLLKEIAPGTIQADHSELGSYFIYAENSEETLFCDNETNFERLYGTKNQTPHPKDAINDYLINGKVDAVNADKTGTKAAYHYHLKIASGSAQQLRLRIASRRLQKPFAGFTAVLKERLAEADEFYGELQAEIPDADGRNIQRQALAGMLWSKQFYYYDVTQWLKGDPGQPAPPSERFHGRNCRWEHLHNANIISMPDKWEYPWYAAWDLAFHCIPLAMVDPEFAKEQLVLLTREWYMHPNGQLPAYEWAFDDVNPPVHAWATWRVYKMDCKHNSGCKDLDFLERVFHKLLLNFTWWVNREDAEGLNIFQGGFLGLDNIGVFDRSAPLPTGGHIEQSDGTSWMAMYSLNMMRIALELSLTKPIYQDIATKFFEHFLYIAQAMSNCGCEGIELWDDEDQFYYDVLHTENHQTIPLKIRSIVGLIPLFAVEILEPEFLERVPQFKERLEWFLNHRPDLARLVSRWYEPGVGQRRLLSLLRGHRMKMLLKRMLDESEFLSDYGVRALSKFHKDHPYKFHLNGQVYQVDYEPGESSSGLFGGNSNWRGPIWFPVNFLLIESLQRFHHYYGDDFKVECPTGSGKYRTILEISEELSRRLVRIFMREKNGRRPAFGKHEKFQEDEHFKDYLLFYEYFHGDNGRGVGASHQTGWTGLIAKLLQPRLSK